MPTNGFELLEQRGFKGSVELLFDKNSKTGRAIREIIRRNKEAEEAFKKEGKTGLFHYLEELVAEETEEHSPEEIRAWAKKHGIDAEKAGQIVWDKRAMLKIDRIIANSGNSLWAVAPKRIAAFLQNEARLARNRHHAEAWGPPQKKWKKHEHDAVAKPAALRRRKPI